MKIRVSVVRIRPQAPFLSDASFQTQPFPHHGRRRELDHFRPPQGRCEILAISRSTKARSIVGFPFGGLGRFLSLSFGGPGEERRPRRARPLGLCRRRFVPARSEIGPSSPVGRGGQASVLDAAGLIKGQNHRLAGLARRRRRWQRSDLWQPCFTARLNCGAMRAQIRPARPMFCKHAAVQHRYSLW